jgi:hypothetical protein
VKRAEPNPKQFSDDLDETRAMKVGEPKSAEGVISSPKITDVDKSSCGSVQDKDTGTNTLGASSNVFAGMKSGSAVVTRGCSSEISEKVSPSGGSVQQHQRWSELVQKYGVAHDGSKRDCTNNNASNVHALSEKPHARTTSSKSAAISTNEYARACRNFEIGGPSEQRNIFSAKDTAFAPRTYERQYRPKFFRNSKIMSVAPGTKPGPRWCPTGLSHTQKRRVQRLRTLAIREEIAGKKRDEMFNRERPMVFPKKTWREKRLAAEEN